MDLVCPDPACLSVVMDIFHHICSVQISFCMCLLLLLSLVCPVPAYLSMVLVIFIIYFFLFMCSLLFVYYIIRCLLYFYEFIILLCVYYIIMCILNLVCQFIACLSMKLAVFHHALFCVHVYTFFSYLIVALLCVFGTWFVQLLHIYGFGHPLYFIIYILAFMCRGFFICDYHIAVCVFNLLCLVTSYLGACP